MEEKKAIQELIEHAERSRVNIITIFKRYFIFRENSNPMHSLDMTIRYYNLDGQHFEDSIRLTHNID